MYKKGLTLIEIIVSTLVIVLTLTGLVHLFVVGKRLIVHSHARISGGELGRVFLDRLQREVREDTWGQSTNDLTTGTPRYCDSDPSHTTQQQQHCPTKPERTLDSIEYSATYVISDLFSPNLRKVLATINWNEPAP